MGGRLNDEEADQVEARTVWPRWPGALDTTCRHLNDWRRRTLRSTTLTGRYRQGHEVTRASRSAGAQMGTWPYQAFDLEQPPHDTSDAR